MRTIYHSPWSYAEKEVGQLGNVLRIGAVAVEEMAFLDKLPQLSSSRSVIIAWTKFDEFVANSWAWHHYYWNLILNTKTHFVYNIEKSICNQDTNYFTARHSLSSLLSLSYFKANINFELYFSSPFQIFIRII